MTSLDTWAAGLDAADEVPRSELDSRPLWSENYCSQAYDPSSGVGVWMHLGRTHYDPTLWREAVALYLPGGDHVVIKGYGRGPEDLGPCGATVRFSCDRPWRQWTKTVRGSGVRLPRGQAWDGLLTDGLHIPVEVSLTFEGIQPVWNVGAEMRRQTWGDSHYEQICGVHGTLRWGQETLEFHGHGVRDHTRGPRDYRTINKHCWLSGYFPSGRGFMVVDIDVQGHHMRRAVLTTPDAVEEAEVLDTPFLADHTQHSQPYQLTLRDGQREQVTITAEQLHVMPFGFIGESELVLGYAPDKMSHQVYEGMTRFTLDGEVGYGLTERSAPTAHHSGPSTDPQNPGAPR
jgi:hypothetical protein